MYFSSAHWCLTRRNKAIAQIIKTMQKRPKVFQSMPVVATEKYSGKVIIVTEMYPSSDLPIYFWFVCDRLHILSDNTKDFGEDRVEGAIAIAKNVIDNFL